MTVLYNLHYNEDNKNNFSKHYTHPLMTSKFMQHYINISSYVHGTKVF